MNLQRFGDLLIFCGCASVHLFGTSSDDVTVVSAAVVVTLLTRMSRWRLFRGNDDGSHTDLVRFIFNLLAEFFVTIAAVELLLTCILMPLNMVLGVFLEWADQACSSRGVKCFSNYHEFVEFLLGTLLAAIIDGYQYWLNVEHCLHNASMSDLDADGDCFSPQLDDEYFGSVVLHQ